MAGHACGWLVLLIGVGQMSFLCDSSAGLTKNHRRHRTGSRLRRDRFNLDPAGTHGEGKVRDKPNIVLLISDDQDVELGSMEYMRQTLRIFRQGGAECVNGFVTTPLCCPSRSSILTGRYVHNHHVTGNKVNCSTESWQRLYERQTFASYVNAAGYRTGYFGKYLNNYRGNHIPHGWDEWMGLIRNSRYYNYTLNYNGRKIKHGSQYEFDYLTDVIVNDSIAFFEKSKRVAPEKPLLMVLSFPAPHGPEDPAPQYNQWFENVTSHRTPSWNYAPNPDKQWLLRHTGKLEPIYVAFTDALHRRRLQTLQSVDDAVHRLYRHFRDYGELRNTYMMYTSDHGYHLGQYGLVKGKNMPYEFDVKVPFFIRGPGIPKHSTIWRPVLNIDIAPTILDMAGVPPPSQMDGESIMPLLRFDKMRQKGLTTNVLSWRHTFLLERGRSHKKLSRIRDRWNLQRDMFSKELRIQKECQKTVFQSPCKVFQQWECRRDSIGRWRIVKCRGRLAIRRDCVCLIGDDGEEDREGNYGKTLRPRRRGQKSKSAKTANRQRSHKFPKKNDRIILRSRREVVESELPSALDAAKLVEDYFNTNSDERSSGDSELNYDYWSEMSSLNDMAESSGANLTNQQPDMNDVYSEAQLKAWEDEFINQISQTEILQSGEWVQGRFDGAEAASSCDSQIGRDLNGDFEIYYEDIPGSDYENEEIPDRSDDTGTRFDEERISKTNNSLRIKRSLVGNFATPTVDPLSGTLVETRDRKSRRRHSDRDRRKNALKNGHRNETANFVIYRGCRVYRNRSVACRPRVYSDFHTWRQRTSKLSRRIKKFREHVKGLKSIRKHLRAGKPTVGNELKVDRMRVDSTLSNGQTKSKRNDSKLQSHRARRPKVCSCGPDLEKEVQAAKLRRQHPLKSASKSKKTKRSAASPFLDSVSLIDVPSRLPEFDSWPPPLPHPDEFGNNETLLAKFTSLKPEVLPETNIHQHLSFEESDDSPSFVSGAMLGDEPHVRELELSRHSDKKMYCNVPLMNCFTHDNFHWKTEPRWTYGPFCFCQNSLNNTYWCLRTINETHNFVYCEFITGFISYYDLNQDYYQMHNAAYQLEPHTLEQLSAQLSVLRDCKGSPDCNQFRGQPALDS